jgi:hypothetical protein
MKGKEIEENKKNYPNKVKADNNATASLLKGIASIQKA